MEHDTSLPLQWLVIPLSAEPLPQPKWSYKTGSWLLLRLLLLPVSSVPTLLHLWRLPASLFFPEWASMLSPQVFHLMLPSPESLHPPGSMSQGIHTAHPLTSFRSLLRFTYAERHSWPHTFKIDPPLSSFPCLVLLISQLLPGMRHSTHRLKWLQCQITETGTWSIMFNDV